MPLDRLGEAFTVPPVTDDAPRDTYELREELRNGVELRRQDVRRGAPDGLFDLVLCRNLAFTYFDPAVQRRLLARIASRLYRGGVLVVGSHETLPENRDGFARIERSIYRKA